MENDYQSYYVRKNNTIPFRSNFYSLPEGTYQGRGSQVLLKQAGQTINLYSLDEQLICSHQIASSTGKTVINTNHRRDRSNSLKELMSQTASRFSDPDQARQYFGHIQERLPRYTRDHLQCILKALTGVAAEQADKALNFCLTHQLYSGTEFEQVLRVQTSETKKATQTDPITLLHADVVEKARQAPEVSKLDDYESIINP